MSLNWPKPNHNHASEYQVAGWPFVTSSVATTSPAAVVFPQVTQWFQVRNQDGTNALRIGFTAEGVDGTNYFLVPPTAATSADGMTPVYSIKCKELWVRSAASTANYSVIAGLTNVDGSEFSLSGSTGV